MDTSASRLLTDSLLFGHSVALLIVWGHLIRECQNRDIQ